MPASAAARVSQALLLRAADRLCAAFPRRRPARSQLDGARIVAHRGAHQEPAVVENTLRAFDRAIDAGAWGIEFDIRWTRDERPVVFHDPDTKRLFGAEARLRDLDLAELQDRFPLIPTLDEVVQRYGKRIHLMAEVKGGDRPEDPRLNGVLGETFSGLNPAEDYHLLALEPGIFQSLTFAPPSSFLPVAEWNVRQMSDFALAKACAGLAGHYLLLTDRILEKHKRAGQKIATGYVATRSCLYREISRGVDWIFTNTAVRICTYLNEPSPASRGAKCPGTIHEGFR